MAGLDLAHYGTEADAETIRRTEIAQPLLVATGLVAALDLFPHPADAFQRVGAVAGHSVGELAAAAGARVITAEQAMVLVRERGKAMADAAAQTPTGMTAVLGGDREEVLAVDRASTASPPPTTTAPARSWPPAPSSSSRRSPTLRPAKARLIPLSVAGAFHTSHMQPAVGHLAGAGPLGLHARPAHGGDLQPRRPGRPRRPRRAGPDRRPDRRPVRWDLCMDAMLDLGVTGILEMPPAGTLTGIAKRAMKGVETFALKTPDQLDDARAFVDKHGERSHDRDHARPGGWSSPPARAPSTAPRRPPTPTSCPPAA